jgi:hypothetical protein
MNRTGTRFRPALGLALALLAGPLLIASGCATGPGPVGGFGRIVGRVALPAAPIDLAAISGGSRVAVLSAAQVTLVAWPSLTEETLALPGPARSVAWRSTSSLAVSAADLDRVWAVAGTPAAATTMIDLSALATAAGVARVQPGALAWRGDLAWIALGVDGLGAAAVASPSLGTSALPYRGLVTGAGTDVAATPDGARVAVGLGTSVMGADGLTQAVSWTRALTHPASRLCASPRSDVVLACGPVGEGNAVSVLSATSGTLRGTRAVRAGTGDMAFTSAGGYAFVAETDSVAAIDMSGTEYRVIMRATTPGQPVALSLSPDGQRLLVACAGTTNELLVLEAGLGG